ncbi:hypothetical protein PCANC_11267 [Puccinia coronata f. sp. avenae]|uniref:Transglycosylase SLT domain-containing protein n=1 Tax=Puccinia coronata f. sp. avenae TaxID=200324 RepID=A0A2N5T6A1_9BASI|nr:hypothetical protein PCANC_11267 [Puccinia coronata f. sp. avenae]
MCSRPRSSRFFILAVLASCFLSSLASDLGKTYPASSVKLLEKRTDAPITDTLKTFRKPTQRKMRTIHRRNTQYHKKAKKLNKSCGDDHDRHDTKNDTQNSEKPTPEAKTNHTAVAHGDAKDKYSLPAESQAIGSILHATSSCGNAQPTEHITTTSGPNGNEAFLNCGLSADGWKPPHVTMDMLTHSSLDQEPAKSTFAPCQKYRQKFEKYGAKYGIPPIFLAAFAMQESTCRPDVVGDQGGAFGLMQITKDKCGGAPGGNCADPDYNIDMGAKTFASGLTEANGNVLLAVGGYNGWTPGLTKQKALQHKDEGCCVCQQNLDYLHQFVNAWILGVDPQTRRLGTNRNLDVCGES